MKANHKALAIPLCSKPSTAVRACYIRTYARTRDVLCYQVRTVEAYYKAPAFPL